MTKGLCLSLLVLFTFLVADAQKRRWSVPTYQGLTLEKSTKADAERIFGKPVWSGHPEDERDNPVKSLISYKYENVGGFEGRTVIWTKARTGVITDILLYPSEQKPIPIEKVGEKYGTDYIELESGLGPCPTPKEIRKYKPPIRREYPIFFVYPRKGMIVSVAANNKVQEISYLSKCL